MRTIILFRGALCALLLLAAGCGKPKQQLNVFVWSDFLDPQLVADFERQFDCEVVLDLFEDPDSMMAKMAAGGVSLYDIVVPSNSTLPALVKRGMLARLSRDKIPNLANLDPQFSNRVFEKSDEFGIPCDCGTTGILLRQKGKEPAEESWALLFDPAKQPGPFLLIEDVRSCVGAALLYRGHSLNSTDTNQLAEARRILIETKRRSLGFEGGTGCKNRVISKGAAAAMAYNGDAARAIAEDPELRFILPREGAEFWLDFMSIPAKAPHRELAEKFLNFLMEPRNSARFANFTRLATPNKAAREFVNPADLKNPAIYPTPEMMSRLEITRDLGEKNRLYDELWTEVKSE